MTGLTADPLDLAALIAAVSDPEHGGLAAFLGCIRREDAIRPVVAIEYEAYEELTETEFAAVAPALRCSRRRGLDRAAGGAGSSPRLR